MEKAPGDSSVNFSIAFYKIGTSLKWDTTEEGESYGGGPSIYIYIYICVYIYIYILV